MFTDVNFNSVSGKILPSLSVLDLSRDPRLSEKAPFSSGLVERVAGAATVPLNDLTCAQVRLLVGQGVGLQWLAKPVASFCAQHPRGQCDIFPGDLTVNALRYWRIFLSLAPRETKVMISADLEWLADDVAETNDPLFKEALQGLNAARSVVNSE